MKALAVMLALVVAHGCHARGDEVAIEAQGLRVRIDGVSATAVGDVKSVVEAQAAMTVDKTVTPPLADDLAYFVRQSYRDLGYRDAEVTWEVADGAALLHVKEGERYIVGDITYAGNSSQSESDLNGYLLRPTHEKLGMVGKSAPFVEADLKAGASLVQRYFQAQGFLNAVVAPPEFTPHPATRTADVLVRVKEGRRFTFDTVTATGDLAGSEREVEKQLIDLSGQPFNEARVETVRRNIIGIHEQRGHFAAVVSAEFDLARKEGGRVAVVYRITPGPRFHIANLDIAPGFSHGAQRVLRGSFKRVPGRIYSPAELEFMSRRALDTAVFSKLDVKPRTSGDDTLALDITGEEGPRTTLSASLGYETFEGIFLRAEARQVNFMDTGNAVRALVEHTVRSQRAAIKWRDPVIFESAYSLDAELAAQAVQVFDYERRTLSLRTTLNRQWSKRVSANIFAEGSANQAESSMLTAEELGPADYNLGTLGAGLLLDYRDSPVLPARGWMTGVTLTGAGGGASYLRGDVLFAYYQPITKKLRAAFSAKSSIIHNSGGVENLPIDLRVFNGGSTSVRSFAEREMGPRSREGDTPLGGRMSQTLSIELSREIRPGLELALFGDVGNLSDTVSNPFSQPSGLRHAIGLGVRYKLPIGPLRIDYGFNPDRQRGEPVGALHVTFGFAF